MCDCNGNRCENRDHCRNIYCSGNGECINSADGFTCLCAPDYTGEFCDVEIDDCMGVECANGECVDGSASFECVCEAGYTGDLCGVDINECDSVNCGSNGECKQEWSS